MSKEKSPTPYVREGQVWEDNDPRNAGRTLRVERVYEDGLASCKVITKPYNAVGTRRAGGSVRISLHRFNSRRNGYSLVSEPSIIGKSAEERAQQVAGWAGFPDTVGSALVKFVERSFKEHARDQRHLCAEAVPTVSKTSEVATDPIDAHADALNAAHAAVMNAPEPGTHNG